MAFIVTGSFVFASEINEYELYDLTKNELNINLNQNRVEIDITDIENDIHFFSDYGNLTNIIIKEDENQKEGLLDINIISLPQFSFISCDIELLSGHEAQAYLNDNAYWMHKLNMLDGSRMPMQSRYVDREFNGTLASILCHHQSQYNGFWSLRDLPIKDMLKRKQVPFSLATIEITINPSDSERIK